MSNTEHKGITRVDRPKDHLVGYLVRVQWRGTRMQTWIPDNRYQDPLNQAIRWRNRFEKELGKPRSERLIRSSGRLPWMKKSWKRKGAGR
jgi:hypothetical protein